MSSPAIVETPDPPAAAGRPAARRPARPNAKKLLFAVHGWLGLSLGLPLFVICLSGTFAVVSHEIDWLLTPAVRAPAHGGPVNWAAVAENALRRYPDGRLTLLTAPVGRGFAAQAWVETPGGKRRVFADPATGEVTGETGWFNAQRFFRDFHRRFFWFSAWGITLVSSFAVVLLTSVGTGLLFYKRWWAKLFTLRPHKGARVFWSDLHRLTGIWTLLFALVIAVTGVWYLVEGPATKMIQSRGSEPARTKGDVAVVAKADPAATSPAAADGGRGKRRSADPSGAKASRLVSLGPVAEPLSVEDYVTIARKAYPELAVRSIWFPTRVGEPVRVDGQAEAWLVRDRANEVRLDLYTGEVISVQRAEDLDPAVRWIDTADPLHFGDFGGLTSKLVWFAFGLVLSGLIPTGLYLWLKRAEQAAAGVTKRLAGEPHGDVQREIRRATRRRIGLGFLVTTGILVWAAVCTCRALTDELPTPVTRAATPLRQLGPWTVSAFRDCEAPRPGELAIFGVRFEGAVGDANFRRASLAFAETAPAEDGWRPAAGGIDERKAKLAVPDRLTGRECLWVSIEGWDGTRSVGSFVPETFKARSDMTPPSAWQTLGGPPVVLFCGAFSAFLVGASAVWYRLVWLRPHRRPKTRAALKAR